MRLFVSSLLCCLMAACAQATVQADTDWQAFFAAREAAHPVTNWNHLAQAWQTNGFANASPVEGIRSAVEFDDGTAVKAVLTADKGAFRKDGLMKGEGVKIVFQDEQGNPDGQITAQEVVFDREKKIGMAVGKVRIDRDGDVIAGNHAIFAFEDKFIRMLSEASVVTPRVKMRLDLR